MQTEWRDKVLIVSGDITVSTLGADAYRRYCAELDGRRPDCIDFGGVGRADSACLSLLAAARRRFPDAVFNRLPSSVGLLADLYEIEHWIKK